MFDLQFQAHSSTIPTQTKSDDGQKKFNFRVKDVSINSTTNGNHRDVFNVSIVQFELVRDDVKKHVT